LAIPSQRHQKARQRNQKIESSFNFSELNGKPFWIWNKQEHLRYAQEWEHGDPQAIVNLIFNLYLKYGSANTFIWVDCSNRAFCNLLKVAFSESLNWERSRITPNSMKVLPVSFATEHKQLLSHLAMMISKEYLCIPKEYDKLAIVLRTAYAIELSLDKEQSSYSDSLDALRLACKMYKMN
jgi:hypothetical protein